MEGYSHANNRDHQPEGGGGQDHPRLAPGRSRRGFRAYRAGDRPRPAGDGEPMGGMAAGRAPGRDRQRPPRSEEHTSELQSLMRISYAVFCLKKKKYSPEAPLN